MFSQSQLQAIADALGDTADGLTGSEISHLLTTCKMGDPSPQLSKRHRLYNAFAGTQNAKQDRIPILAFIRHATFLNHYAIPIVWDVMQRIDGIGPEQARQALLCEFWHSGDMHKYCLQTGSRTTQSPFIKKYLEKTGLELMRAWKEGKLERACPDFAFGSPFPYKVVFEGKYFERGSQEQAATALVTVIREAFFYRSFPCAPPNRLKPAWGYDFSCAIICDASEEGSLQACWRTIPEQVRKSFWEGANLYVMIVRGRDNGNELQPTVL
jgi:hypothetical protein